MEVQNRQDHTIQSMLLASVFQIAISEIKRFVNNSYQCKVSFVPHCGTALDALTVRIKCISSLTNPIS